MLNNISFDLLTDEWVQAISIHFSNGNIVSKNIFVIILIGRPKQTS